MVKEGKRSVFVPSNTKRIAFFLLADIFISLFSLYAAYLLRFNFTIPDPFLTHFTKLAFILITLKILFLFLFKNYSIIWRFYGLNEAKNLVLAHLISYSLFAFIVILSPEFFTPFPREASLLSIWFSLSYFWENCVSLSASFQTAIPRTSC